jgi:DNA repair protein RAD5
MFMQWTALMRTVRGLLCDGGVQACAVYGNLNTVNAALQKFHAGEADVLLLSLETSTAGLNLVHANHVIFAHALVSGGATWQKKLVDQAVGRVNRLGQDKQVEVHWFITEDTDEQHVYDAYQRVHA